MASREQQSSCRALVVLQESRATTPREPESGWDDRGLLGPPSRRFSILNRGPAACLRMGSARKNSAGADVAPADRGRGSFVFGARGGAPARNGFSTAAATQNLRHERGRTTVVRGPALFGTNNVESGPPFAAAGFAKWTGFSGHGWCRVAPNYSHGNCRARLSASKPAETAQTEFASGSSGPARQGERPSRADGVTGGGESGMHAGQPREPLRTTRADPFASPRAPAHLNFFPVMKSFSYTERFSPADRMSAARFVSQLFAKAEPIFD